MLKNVISKSSAKNQVLTSEEIHKLKEVKNSTERLKIVRQAPFVLPYVLNSWSDDKNITKIVELAIKLMPENVTKLGKGNIVPTKELVNLAIEQKPSIVFEMNEQLKSLIDIDSFVNVFTKAPEICTCDAPVLKQKISRDIQVYRKGDLKNIKYKLGLREECLKAIRIAMGVSKQHNGYDDYAGEIAERLKKSKALDKNQTKYKMATKLATVANALIKKQDVRVYSMPVEVWELNNYKTLYLAVRESVKKDSKLSGILEFIPFKLLPEKVTRKVVATALKKDPCIWSQLEQYNLGYLKENPFIQYVTYKSCKKYKRMDIIETEFSDKQKLTAENKIKGILKRKDTKIKKLTKIYLPSVIYKTLKMTNNNINAKKDEEMTF
ncbi:MAG: hypothetical protein ACI4TZ_01935 [Christensenellales bacterium]